MKNVLATACTLIALTSLWALPTQDAAAKSKKWTVTTRLEALNREIEKGWKANQLTAKEAESLREEAGKIQGRIDEMKAKNADQLSVKDQNKLEKELNKLSEKIQKLELDKRVQ